MIEQEWQALCGEDVDGGDVLRDEEVEGEAENRGARTPFELKAALAVGGRRPGRRVAV